MKIGIVGYGAYIPKFRIKTQEIAQFQNQDPHKIINGLKIEEKSVPGIDEDTATISHQAALNSIARAKIDKKKIGAIYIGSESHPYAVKPTSTIVGQALNIGNNYTAADLEFACKAGTAALQAACGLTQSKIIEYGLAIGTDTAQAEPGDVLEFSASAGGAAFLVGSNENEFLASIEKTLSFSSDTPDFWRRNLQKFPQHMGRFTGEPSYFKHVIETTKKFLDENNIQPKDLDHVVFHQPNGKFPTIAAKKLGFSLKQIETGLLAPKIGNCYSGSSLVGLTSILDVAKPNQKILLVSYGSGSGCDAFIFTTTKHLTQKQKLAPTTNNYIDNKKYLTYLQYQNRICTK
jgi:hydroxymethylglutaryl-CoA synthase